MANAGDGSKGDPKAFQAISQGVRSLASELETRPEKRANGLAGTHEPSSYGIGPLLEMKSTSNWIAIFDVSHDHKSWLVTLGMVYGTNT